MITFFRLLIYPSCIATLKIKASELQKLWTSAIYAKKNASILLLRNLIEAIEL